MPFHRERVFKLSVFKLSALAAPLRRSCSALMLAVLSAAVAGAQPAGHWTIETIAGGSGSAREDGGPAVAAQLSNPLSVAVDGAGNLYIADVGNNRIRKVDPAGVITTVAGTGARGLSGDGGAAVEARLGGPQGVAVDGAGNLYIAHSGRIRKVTAAGVIFKVVGGGLGGDGGPGTAAQLDIPADVALDGAGNLYIAEEYGHRIRKVDAATGVITTVAGTGARGFSGDGGAAVEARLYQPTGVAVDGAGNLYIADTGNSRIRKVDAAGVITTVAGGGSGGDGGAAVAAQLRYPRGVALDGSGNLYIADVGNNRIRKVDPAGVITTVAGDGTRGYSGDGGAATGGATEQPRRRSAGRSGHPVHRR